LTISTNVSATQEKTSLWSYYCCHEHVGALELWSCDAIGVSNGGGISSSAAPGIEKHACACVCQSGSALISSWNASQNGSAVCTSDESCGIYRQSHIFG
jgi:hypothetical protein